MIVTSFTKNTKPGVLIGHLTILYETEFGLRWESDIKLFMKNGHRWVGFPSKGVRDAGGNIKYEPLSGFNDRSDHTKWQKACLTALDKFCENGEASSYVQFDSDPTYQMPYKDD